jgi:FkbM family methyltransferase
MLGFWGEALEKGAQPHANEDGLYFLGENCHGHLYEDHERWLEPWMLEGLTETSVAVDVGMHVGNWTMKLAQKCARVYSVEPSDGPRTCAKMTAKVRGHENIVFHACALDEKPGTARLHEECGGSHLGIDGPEVRVCTFDELFVGLNRLDLVKIDTEGAEAMILRGGRQAISALKPRMIIEVHQFAAGLFDADPYGAILAELGRLGYSSKRIGGHDANFYLQALPTRGRHA